MKPREGRDEGFEAHDVRRIAFIGYTTRKLEISNELGVDMADASESTYGPMSAWRR